MFSLTMRAPWLLCVLLVAGVSQSDEIREPNPTPLAVSLAPAVSGDLTAQAVPHQAIGAEPTGKIIYRICRTTAYCDLDITASGISAGVGQCAAPADIPFGALVYIPALERSFIVTDRTARRFRHNTVDIFLPERAECRRFGRQYLECVITLPVDPPGYGSPALTAAVRDLQKKGG